MGVPVLRAADGHERQAVRRLDRHADDAEHDRRRTRAGRRQTAWDPYVGYFQLSRFKFVDDAPGAPAHLDLESEQQILRVSNNRQECCHVAGDIDFDKHNNLWLVTGDDTPAGGIDAGGFGPFNDQMTDEQQTVRVTNATGGTFTLTFNGQTTAPLPFNATAAQIDAALEALSNIGADNIQTSGGPVNTANVNVFFRRALEQQTDQTQITADGDRPDRHRRRPWRSPPTGAGGRLVPARRPATTAARR